MQEYETPIGQQMMAAHSAYYRELSKHRKYVDASQIGNGPWGHKVKRGYNKTVNLEDTWRSIAKMCVEAGLSADDYITETMSVILDDGGTIGKPEDLAKLQFFSSFSSHRRTSKEMLQAHWRNQEQQLIGTSQRLGVTTEWLLHNPYQSFEIWFRVLYLQPYSEKIHAVWARFAADQIKGDKSLRSFLRECAPENYQILQDKLGERFTD